MLSSTTKSLYRFGHQPVQSSGRNKLRLPAHLVHALNASLALKPTQGSRLVFRNIIHSSSLVHQSLPLRGSGESRESDQFSKVQFFRSQGKERKCSRFWCIGCLYDGRFPITWILPQNRSARSPYFPSSSRLVTIIPSTRNSPRSRYTTLRVAQIAVTATIDRALREIGFSGVCLLRGAF